MSIPFEIIVVVGSLIIMLIRNNVQANQAFNSLVDDLRTRLQKTEIQIEKLRTRLHSNEVKQNEKEKALAKCQELLKEKESQLCKENEEKESLLSNIYEKIIELLNRFEERLG